MGGYTDMYAQNKYETPTVLHMSSRIFLNFQISFTEVVWQEILPQRDDPGKCQSEKGGYFTQTHEE